MTAGKHCNRKVVIAESIISIIEAAKLMRKHHVGDLVVVNKKGEDNIPVGFITDRNLVIEVLAQEVPLDAVTFKDFMNTDLVTLREEKTLLDTLECRFSRRQVKHAWWWEWQPEAL